MITFGILHKLLFKKNSGHQLANRGFLCEQVCDFGELLLDALAGRRIQVLLSYSP